MRFFFFYLYLRLGLWVSEWVCILKIFQFLKYSTNREKVTLKYIAKSESMCLLIEMEIIVGEETRSNDCVCQVE